MMAHLSRIFFHSVLCLAVAWVWSPGQTQAGIIGGALEKARIEGRLTAEEAAAIEARVEQARTQGLPAGSLAAKVDEGLAKHIPGQAIIGAVDAMRDDYAFARNALVRGDSAPALADIAMAGDSLRLGLSRPELLEVVGFAPSAPATMLATAAQTRAYLNSIGFAPGLSSDLMRQGLASGALTPGWIQLFRVVQRARERGLADAAVAEASTRTLVEGGELGDLLHELGFTGRDMRQAPGGIGK